MRLRISLAAPLFVLLSSSLIAAEPPSGKPKLAVLVVFDQMRGDYLDKWQPLFVEDGFKRLQTEGTWFDNCHYPYAMTTTGPGHASMLSGCSGDRHGIVANNWYDINTGSKAYCATSKRYERIPPVPKKNGKTDSNEDEGYGAPTQMLAETLGDVIKATGGKVFGLALKDRSAILPAGKKPDGCYWFDKGLFVTSTYYRDRLHPWVTRFNEEKSCDRWFGKTWEKLRPDLDYDKYTGPDLGPGEDKGAGPKNGPWQGVTFPHTFALGPTIDSYYYSALVNSPMGSEVLFDLMRLAVMEEKLGQRDATDLLIVSFASNDSIGHCWGPDSHEVLDVTLRSDLLMRDMLKFLDSKVGKGNYVIGLTADHGICPLPEFSLAQGRMAQRFDPQPLVTAAESHLRTKFGAVGDTKSRYIEVANEGGFYLNRRLIATRNTTVEAVAEELANWLSNRPELAAAYTAAQLSGKLPENDPFAQKMRKCFRADRSGDVLIVLKPYYLISTRKTGTTHGSPHPYDSHVPLIVYGPGLSGGRNNSPVTPQAVAAILAKAVGVPAPSMAEAPVPAGLFK